MTTVPILPKLRTAVVAIGNFVVCVSRPSLLVIELAQRARGWRRCRTAVLTLEPHRSVLLPRADEKLFRLS